MTTNTTTESAQAGGESVLTDAEIDKHLAKAIDLPTVYERAAFRKGFRARAALSAPPADRRKLMRFYAVDSVDALIAAQAEHIEKLQSKLPQAPSFAPQRVREG